MGDRRLGDEPPIRIESKVTISEVLETHPGSIAVEAHGLTFTDSSGLAAMLDARAAADEAGVTFRIREPSPALRRTAELAGVEDLLPYE